MSWSKCDCGSVLEVLGLFYVLTDPRVIALDVQFGQREKLVSAIDVAASSILSGAVNVSAIRSCLGCANYILCSTRFMAGRHLFSDLYALVGVDDFQVDEGQP